MTQVHPQGDMIEDNEISLTQLDNPNLSDSDKAELLDRIVKQALQDMRVLAAIEKSAMQGSLDPDLIEQARSIIPPEESRGFVDKVLGGEFTSDILDAIGKIEPVITDKEGEHYSTKNGDKLKNGHTSSTG